MGNKREERVSLHVPRVLGASLLRRLRALRLQSPRGPHILLDHCLLPPRDQSLRIRQKLQSLLELPGGCEQ